VRVWARSRSCSRPLSLACPFLFHWSVSALRQFAVNANALRSAHVRIASSLCCARVCSSVRLYFCVFARAAAMLRSARTCFALICPARPCCPGWRVCAVCSACDCRVRVWRVGALVQCACAVSVCALVWGAHPWFRLPCVFDLLLFCIIHERGVPVFLTKCSAFTVPFRA
jgi:hypothetical protein